MLTSSVLPERGFLCFSLWCGNHKLLSGQFLSLVLFRQTIHFPWSVHGKKILVRVLEEKENNKNLLSLIRGLIKKQKTSSWLK
jgi:hypothetical protein